MANTRLLDQESFFLFRIYDPKDYSFGEFRFCGYDNAKYGGKLYTGIPCKLTDLRTSVNYDANPNLTVGDVKGQLGRVMSKYTIEGRWVDITTIKRDNLDEGISPNFGLVLPETFEITQILDKNPDYITVKLKNITNTSMVKIPRRTLSHNCSWDYRLPGCNYVSQVRKFNENDEPVTSINDDVCSKTWEACVLRNNQGNFGGIPTIDSV